MSDKILNMFFEIDRWTKAIEKGVCKDIRKDQLILLTDENTRLQIADAMLKGKYEISPPHTAQIPKEGGEYRTVYVNEPIDRVMLSIANDLLFELMPEMTHNSCKSYQKGIGCGKIVKEVSQKIVNSASNVCIGWKSDLSKYFDSVPLQYVDEMFDKVESKYGHSALIDVLRKYYHCDLYFDESNNLQYNYQSLKQGCAVASWLADVLLYDLDEELSQMDGYYIRYSDDKLREKKENYTYCLVGDCYIGYFIDKDNRDEYSRLIMTRRTPMQIQPTIVFSRVIGTYHVTWLEKMVSDNDPKFEKPVVDKGLKGKQINAYMGVKLAETVDKVKIYAHSFLSETIKYTALDNDNYIESKSLNGIKKKLLKEALC